VRIYSEEDAAAMAEQACKEVQEETALGAYLLDYISYTDTQERAYYEMHVRLDGSMTLAEAHERSSLVERRLKERYGAETYVSIHIEPLKNTGDKQQA
jgi:divalent metal cation (Fe/Co/Zn/Cd) transporter